MTNVSINVTQLDTGKIIEVREALQKRFYFLKKVSGQDAYVDIETSTTGVTKQHLASIAIQMGIPTLREAFEIIKHTYFRPIIDKDVYIPGEGKIAEKNGLYFPNSWRPSEVKPNDTAAIEPFLKHMLIVLGSQEKVDYYLDMLAWRYQNPNKPKPHVAFYFYGEKGGSGKSTHVETIQKVFGESAVKVTNTVKKLSDGSSVQLWQRTFLIIEEAAVGKGSELYDKIKSYTGSDYVDDSVKYSHFKKRHIPAQLIMMSNRAPTFIEPNDRRFFISEWTMEGGDAERAEYFKNYRVWLENGGYEAIAHLLANRGVTRNVYEPAMMTTEKVQAQTTAADECVVAIKDYLLDNHESKLFEMDDFKTIFEEHQIRSSQRKHKLAEAGLKQTSRAKVGHKQIRWWIRKNDQLRTGQGFPVKIKTEQGTEISALEVAHFIINGLPGPSSATEISSYKHAKGW
jgi:hypothetical protein